MEGKNVCDNCQKTLDASGSVVFTPADSGAGEKHLCMTCFEEMGASEKK